MIDVGFYMRINEFKRSLNGSAKHDPEVAYSFLENNRSRQPVVFNIETTNACNMVCGFCPRTTQMTRQIKTMAVETFREIANQLQPHPADLWERWEAFAADNYRVPRGEQSENNFFLYILPRVLVLHGYGDPLLDPHMPDCVAALTTQNIPSYFSCNPSNINIERTLRTFDNGLTYIKYSLDAIEDNEHKQIRGKASNYTDGYRKIMELIGLKEQKGYKTQIIITMIDLHKPNQAEEFAALSEAFRDSGVYIYLKSLDQSWLTGADRPPSIHWSEFCQIPWSSMTIKSDGLAASCEEDFNNEIILGDAKTTSLYDIWNGAAYTALRRNHIDLSESTHCTNGKCDMRPVGKFL
jgi:wyosine [tRNA(Phe)-imidazoG37] synthetase (radical SAM superfamily)